MAPTGPSEWAYAADFVRLKVDLIVTSGTSQLERMETADFEEAPYRPNSPYAASKAGADHLVRAWHRTYGLPTIISNCSNNFGPYQFPEKFIPLLIINGLEGRAMPVYGRGENIRDWLFVRTMRARSRSSCAGAE